MPRMRILSATELEQFDKPPVFDARQREQFFEFSKTLLETAQNFRKRAHQVGFLVSCGYFKAAKRFFSPKDYHQRDIDYVERCLDMQHGSFSAEAYANRTRQRHELMILEFYGFRRFDDDAEKFVVTEISGMAQSQLKPKLIFFRCVDRIISQRIQLPGYHPLAELILTVLNRRKRDLSAIIEQQLTPHTRELLEGLFVQNADDKANEEEVEAAPEDISSPSGKTVRYRLTLLKKLSQSTRPTRIRKSIEDLAELTELHTHLTPVLKAMNLTHEGIRYYAGSVIKSQIFQLNQRSDEDRFVHVSAFVAHQYYRLHDNLVDVLLSVIKSFQSSAQREHKERIYGQRANRNQTLSGLLSRLDGEVFDILRQIREVTENSRLSDTDKIGNIRMLLAVGKDNELAGLTAGLENELSDEDYFDVLEARSLRLQSRVSPILKALDFKAQPGSTMLREAIEYFKVSGGVITSAAPLDFLEPQERQAVLTGKNEKFRTSLYKAFLFMHTASGIKSGNMNLEHSYKYRPLDDYLIDKDRWDHNKEDLLKQADLLDFVDPKMVMHGLDKALSEQYQITNAHINAGENPHLKILANGQFQIATPALGSKDVDPLQALFPERHYVPLTEVLATINSHCGFLDELQHWQQRHVRNTVSPRSLIAGVMALGCGIGIHKMGRISSQITENELVHAVNWYLSLDNLQAANDRVIKDMDGMDLPKIYQKDQDKLHTASDGQKFEVRRDSLNANYSFKYFGKGQGVSAYSFIDERNLLWHSLVFSAAERESAYVIDGLMRNDVVKSDIHSTDTHGYSEAIFAATHLLGFSYAPRIKNLKKQQLYIFKFHKNDDQSDWKITPDNYVAERIIEDNWDDFLRLIVTIKLKETTASDIFRRLNSYSKQHALYKAMKAFGQIIKTLFILRYLDELELRQAIEKQLNKVELANRLTRAVAVGSPREYAQAEKEEQEIAEACNRLIKNCIICWNYLYLSHKLAQAETQEDKDHILTAIRTHSVVAWRHLNLLGEYDFSDEKLQDSVGILSTKLAA